MKKNMGIIDRSVRIIAAIVLVILYFTHVISGTLGIILLVIAGMFLVTSIFAVCPLYTPFKIKTTKTEES
jgi:hypothetical protein